MRLPGGLKLDERTRAQRRCLAQQPAQRQLEIPERQAVQEQRLQQRAHFVGAPLEEREQPVHEALLHVPRARPEDADRAVSRREAPRGIPCPVRETRGASSAARCSDFLRPSNSSTSSCRSCWMNPCT